MGRRASRVRAVALSLWLGGALDVPPSFVVDLSRPPRQRWDGALSAILARHPFEYSFLPVFRHHNESLFNRLRDEHWTALREAVTRHWPETAHELAGIAAQFAAAGHSEVTFEYLVGWHYFHELAHTTLAHSRNQRECTGILVQTPEGAVLQGGNMDQSPPEVRNLTLRVRFVDSAGRTAFEGVDWYALLSTGVTRAVRKGYASAQGNWRHGSDRAVARVLADLAGGVPSQVLLFRQLLLSAHHAALAGNVPAFADFAAAAAHQRLAAPMYIVAGGPARGDGVVITRGLAGTDDVVWLGAPGGRFRNQEPGEHFLCQCNTDRWLPDDARDPRRTAAEVTIRKLGHSESASMLGLMAVLSTYPVFNPRTAYTALMSASTGELHVYAREAMCPTDPASLPFQDARYCQDHQRRLAASRQAQYTEYVM